MRPMLSAAVVTLLSCGLAAGTGADAVAACKDFNPGKVVLSLGVISDVHISGRQDESDKFSSALSQMASKAGESDADGLDGVLIVGDLVDNPFPKLVSEFKARYEAFSSPAEIPMVHTLGNHDVPAYRWTSSTAADAEKLRRLLGEEYYLTDKDPDAFKNYGCRHCVIGGCHILSISPSGTQPIVYGSDAVAWLDRQLAELTAEAPDRYVIVLTHPPVTGTVFGSRLGEEEGEWHSSYAHYWASSALAPVLGKYPQAVMFSGHLHFPLNDPRIIWQGGFTAMGCSSLRYMVVEPGGYEYMADPNAMNDGNGFSQGSVLQFDASGNLRLLRMDFCSGEVIGEPLVLPAPRKNLSHLRKYSHARRAVKNKPPRMPEAEITVSEGVIGVRFSSSDDEFVHDFTLSLECNGGEVCSAKVLTDFYRHPQTVGRKVSFFRSLAPAVDGEYVLSVTARDSWEAQTRLVKTFRVASGVVAGK